MRTLGAIVVASVLCFNRPSVLAQGSLTPPGPPAATMKSLDQIEARTPISSAPYTITTSGSYYLTTSVSVNSGNAITISASNVTLNLNGFAISSTASSPTGDAILINNVNNVVIRNGSIKSGVTQSGGSFSGNGFVEGIVYTGSTYDVLVSAVQVSGCLDSGIYLGGSNSNVVESCTVQTAGGYGIYGSVVHDSAATGCGAGILADEVFNCDASAVSLSGNGIYASRVAQNCSGTAAGGYGIIGDVDVVENCYGQSSSGIGLSGHTVLNSRAVSTGGTALNGVAITNCYASNNSAANPTITGTLVRGSYAFNSAAGAAISATYAVADSAGSSAGGSGINVVFAKTASNTYATSTATAGATGIMADVVQDCSASVIDTGGALSFAIHANDSVINCAGLLSGTSGVGTAILAPNITNCYGSAGTGNTSGLSGTNISNSYGITNSGPGAGIQVQNGTVSWCTAQNASGDGIFADRSTVKNCSTFSSLNGIRVGNKCLIEGNTCDINTTGIRVIGDSSTLDGNRVSCSPGGNAFVFESTGTNNLIIRNTVRENGSNPFILTGANNHYGPLVNVSSVAGDISAVSNANHPWANFIY